MGCILSRFTQLLHDILLEVKRVWKTTKYQKVLTQKTSFPRALSLGPGFPTFSAYTEKKSSYTPEYMWNRWTKINFGITWIIRLKSKSQALRIYIWLKVNIQQILLNSWRHEWGGQGCQNLPLPLPCSPTFRTFISRLPPYLVLLPSPINQETQNTSW